MSAKLPGYREKIELNHTLNPSSYKKINFEKLKLKNKGVLGNLVKLNYSDENNDCLYYLKKLKILHLVRKIYLWILKRLMNT